MDYEKKDFRKLYEELVRSDWFNRAYHDKSLGDCPFDIPELAESEDEKVIKALETFINQPEIAEKITFEARIEWLSWLEKQKEQKPILQEDIQKGQAVSLPKDIEAAYQHGLDVGKRMDMDKYCLRSEKWKEVEETAKNEFNKGYEQGLKEGIKSVKWSEEDEKRVKQLIYDTEAIRAGYEKRKESLGDDFNDELIKDCDEQIKWLKSLRPQPMNTIKIDELEDFIDTELHKDEFIRRWPQYAFNVPEHKEGDEYSIGVAVGVGRVINKLRNFIVNKKA